jgi:hypothetical protein
VRVAPGACYSQAMANDDNMLMMAMLSGFLGVVVLMFGGNSTPPHVLMILASVPFFLVGAYGTLFYWARGRFR